MRRDTPATVLYTAWAPFFSGAERALLILIENLDPTRYRPVVAVGTSGELEAELRARGVATAVVPIVYSGVRTLPRWLSTVSSLIRLARRHRAEVIHANDVPSFQPAGYAARWLNCPSITHVRFPDSRDGFSWFLKSRFDHALFVSAALRDAAITEAPELFADRSEVVHDGVRVPDVVNESSRRQVREELGLPHDRPIVALTGQVAEIKGIWEFIEAAGVLIARGVPVSFAILGDDLKGHGALRHEAERVVAEKGLSPFVTFLGFRQDAPRIIPAFDLVTVPSHVEPLGNATLEAMAAGLPVVGSRVGGIPEMVVEDQTGMLVPPRSPVALADAVESLVRNPERRAAFGQAGRDRARTAFSVTAHASRVQSVYDRLRSDAAAAVPVRNRQTPGEGLSYGRQP